MVTRMLGMARSMEGFMEVNMKGMISMVDRINISKRMELGSINSKVVMINNLWDMISRIKVVMTSRYLEDMISSHQSFLVSHLINYLQNNLKLLLLSLIHQSFLVSHLINYLQNNLK